MNEIREKIIELVKENNIKKDEIYSMLDYRIADVNKNLRELFSGKRILLQNDYLVFVPYRRKKKYFQDIANILHSSPNKIFSRKELFGDKEAKIRWCLLKQIFTEFPDFKMFVRLLWKSEYYTLSKNFYLKKGYIQIYPEKLDIYFEMKEEEKYLNSINIWD